MDVEQENLKDNSNTNIPGECHIVQVVSKTKECWHRSHLFQRSPCKETNIDQQLHNGETVSKNYKLHVFASICSGSDHEL